MAGTRFLDNLLQLDANRYEIFVFNQEPFGGYNRIMLSPVLAGEKTLDEIMTHKAEWFADRNIHFQSDCAITEIKPDTQCVIDSDGFEHAFDKLVIATGSNPFILPIQGNQLQGVVSFREIRDVDLMLKAADGGNKAIVIGAGLLGLEAAYGLLKQGMDVTVVHRNPVVMNAQLDAEAGGLLEQHLTSDLVNEKGMNFKLQTNVTEILACSEGEHIRQVKLDTGEILAADLVVMAIGIRPNTELAEQAGIQVGRGVEVNDQLETNAANIFGLGECTEHNGRTYGLVAPIYEQAEVLAKHLTDQPATYTGSLTATMLKVTGVNLYSAGNFIGDDTTEALVFRDPSNAIYRKLIVQSDQLVGLCLFGDVTDGNWLFEKMKSGESIADIRENLVFGQGY